MSQFLKETNAKWIRLYFGANVLIFLLISLPDYLSIWNNSSEFDLIGTRSLVSVIGLIMPIVLVHLISSDTKARIVYFRWKNPLPGSRAFSVFLDSDPRIDVSAIRKKYPNLPAEPAEQNRLWYKIYRKYESDDTVRGIHRDFLLFRDMVTLNLLFLLTLAPLGVFVFASWAQVALYSCVIWLEFFFLNVAAKDRGHRLVCTVLAIESAN